MELELRFQACILTGGLCELLDSFIHFRIDICVNIVAVEGTIHPVNALRAFTY